jgi:predicted permease
VTGELFAIIAPILICAGLGYAWAVKGPEYPVEFVTRAVMNIGAPCLIISSFSKSGTEIGRLADVSLAILAVMAVMLIIGLVLTRLLGLPKSTFMPSLLFGNIGNMGLPLCLFAFGQTGLTLGLAIFLLVFSLHMSLGIAIVAGKGNLASLFRQPVLWATLIAVLLVTMGWQLPAWLDNTTRLLGGFTIPLMLITLGVSLASLKISEWKFSLLFSATRVLGGFLVAIIVASVLGLDRVERGVLILQSSMPVAVFNYLLAVRYGKSPGEVAGMVVLSTLMAFLLLPFIVNFVLLEAG